MNESQSEADNLFNDAQVRTTNVIERVFGSGQKITNIIHGNLM